MIPVKQRISGKLGDEVRGDCFKVCIASILERPYEEVPHFVQQEKEGGYHLDHLNRWLADEGYPFQALYRQVGSGDPMLLWLDGRHGDTWPENPGYWLATVRSKRFEGTHHTIVMHEDRAVFDPSEMAGTPGYDERPYEYEGWHYLFICPEPWKVTRA